MLAMRLLGQGSRETGVTRNGGDPRWAELAVTRNAPPCRKSQRQDEEALRTAVMTLVYRAQEGLA